MEKLFGGGGRSMAVYPVRMVYMPIERGPRDEAVQVLVTVSKRHFKRAVKRNRVKRQMRESYRLNKQLLCEALLPTPDKALALAFIWQSDRLYSSSEVSACVESLLRRLAEKLCRRRDEGVREAAKSVGESACETAKSVNDGVNEVGKSVGDGAHESAKSGEDSL